MLRPDKITDEIYDAVGSVLKVAAAYDQRTVGPKDITAWALAVGDLPEDALMEAVVAFYCEQGTDERTGRRPFVMPNDVIKRVRAARRDRLARNPVPAPESADPGKYKFQLHAMIRKIADGQAEFLAGPRRELPYGGRPPLKAIAAPRQERAERDEAAAKRYRAARDVLATRRDLGEAVLGLARLELGEDAEWAALVERAAELAATHPEQTEHREAS